MGGLAVRPETVPLFKGSRAHPLADDLAELGISLGLDTTEARGERVQVQKK